MTREEIDVLWQQALITAANNKEVFARYEFANLMYGAGKSDGYSIGYDACLDEYEGMTTEQKIREAFEKYKAKTIFPESVCEEDFRAGYLALLNSLELSDWVRDSDNASLYALPEGVEK